MACIVNTHHVSLQFPDGYWPDSDAPPTEDAWNQSVKAFQADLKATQDLVAAHVPICWLQYPVEGRTLLGEALLIADHNPYHLGQSLLFAVALVFGLKMKADNWLLQGM